MKIRNNIDKMEYERKLFIMIPDELFSRFKFFCLTNDIQLKKSVADAIAEKLIKSKK